MPLSPTAHRAPRLSSQWRRFALFFPAVVASLLGCSGKQEAIRTEFWLEALADPILEVDPPALLSLDVTAVTLQGVLVDHRVAFETVADYSLELLSDDGATTVLHYAVGAGRRIPVERGEMVWLTLWQQRKPPQKSVRALKVEVWRPGDFLLARRLLALLQAADLIPEAQLPTELRRIVPGTEISYQTAERIGGSCGRSVVHRQFEQALLDGDGPSKDQTRKPLPPGSRLTIDQARDRYDLLLLDNREVIGGDCPHELDSYWAWSALYVPPPRGTKQLLAIQPEATDAGPANALALPAEASAATAHQPALAPTKPKKPQPLR